VLEGKHIEPFRSDPAASRLRIPERVAGRLLDRQRTFGRPRVAYRDVASATNRLTLIAAIVPAGCVTVHTLFCLKNEMSAPHRDVLCALLNSFVANYLVRLRVTTHVSAGIIARLPVPRPLPDAPLFARLARLSSALRRSTRPLEDPRYIEIQALVARLYTLTRGEFAHVLETFPLVDAETRRGTLAAFDQAATRDSRGGMA
jgi:hypothetical protein